MEERLHNWCARRLARLGWQHALPPQQGISAPRAAARLRSMEIEEPGALGWPLLERISLAHHDEALILLVLAFNAGWLGAAVFERWLGWLADGGSGPPWPDQHDDAIWRARAAFAPMVQVDVTDPERERTAQFLARIWAVGERDELIRMLLWLAGQGHRYGWELEYRRLAAMGREQRMKWRASMHDQSGYAATLQGFVVHAMPNDFAAWDWLRLIDLAWAGRVMGWLDDDEARLFAAHGVDLLSQRYHDWRDVAKAWQRGRSLHEGIDLLEEFEQEWSLLLDAAASPWQLPLSTLAASTLIERSRHLIRSLRGDARHWTLAIASIREPELLYLQGSAPVAPDDELRKRSREYLDNVLDWREQEGSEGIERFWMPGQVHHLNQLASDAAHSRLPAPRTPFGSPPPNVLFYRERLAACVNANATIFMAEKYAFHLQMLVDAGYFNEARLAAHHRRLAGALARAYSSPQQMLEAWADWERTLPDGDGDTLLDDILWHGRDPGSPFHWLTPPAGVHREPGVRPSLSRFAALSLSGPLNAPLWGDPEPQYGSQATEIHDWLDSHYGLSGPEQLIRFLDFLVDAGDRQEYLINYAPYTLNPVRLDQEIDMLESAGCSEDEKVHLDRLKRVRGNDDQCNDTDMAAWDIAQLVDLAAAGRQLGWLDSERLGRYLDDARALAAEHYSDWCSYAAGMLAGYSFFMMGTPERNDFLAEFKGALVAWLTGLPPLSGGWASVDFPGSQSRHWPPYHADTLPGDARVLH
ncbi:YbeU/YbeR family protein [Kushneria aurantia]|uniref:DUF1266 domain-containing protein n=1 Tax=Kushneria aurantia TaxID=504092 RepID=A0ABV6G2Z3_9GAMM|nr:YbeU/YbeR family protein [Kushneria aurantia]